MASKLRAKLFAQTKRKFKLITPAFFDGDAIELREMSVAERRDLIAATADEEGERDSAHFEAMVVIACAFDPETGEKVLGDADRDTLIELPASVLDEIALPALTINGLAIDSDETALKNSATTPNVSTNTDSPNASA
jgi:hypothetical protein